MNWDDARFLLQYVGLLTMFGVAVILTVDALLRALRWRWPFLYTYCGAVVGLLLLLLLLFLLDAMGAGAADQAADGEPPEMPILLAVVLGAASAGIYSLIVGRGRQNAA